MSSLPKITQSNMKPVTSNTREDSVSKKNKASFADLQSTSGLSNARISRSRTSSLQNTLEGSSLVHQHRPPPVAMCGSMPSPYDEAIVRNYDAKLLSNKVPNTWYKRYVTCLPDCSMQYQPFDEVEIRDEGIAIQHYLGTAYRALLYPKDAWARKEKETLVKRYRKIIQPEIGPELSVHDPTKEEFTKMLSLRSIIAAKKAREETMSKMFGPSGPEKRKLEPILGEFLKLRNKRKREDRIKGPLAPGSKWRLLHTPLIRKKLADMYKSLFFSSARYRFMKAIRIVFNLLRFLTNISRLAGDTHTIFKCIRQFKAERDRLLSTSSSSEVSHKKKFNPDRYIFTKEVKLTQDMKLCLTCASKNRTPESIQSILEALQQIRTFVEYPLAYQRLLIRTAWYIVVPAYRVIIRQEQFAVNYYVLISGRARMERLVRDADDGCQDSEIVLLKNLKAQDSFGEECITRPGSVRDFSVTTETTCEILSINCHEFEEMLLTSSKYEDTPEHIKFLGSLSFLKNFPKLMLIQDAVGNINVAHFVNGTVVTTNANTSDWVYAVYYGSCLLLREIVPKQTLQQKLGKRKQFTLDDDKVSSLSTPPPRPLETRTPKPSITANVPTIKTPTPEAQHFSRTEFFHNKKQLIEKNAHLRNVLAKEMEKRHNEYLSYTTAFLNETREIEEKCRHLSKSMTTFAQNRFFGGILPTSLPTDKIKKVAVHGIDWKQNLDENFEQLLESQREDYGQLRRTTKKSKADTPPSSRRNTVAQQVLEEQMNTSQVMKLPKLVGSKISLADAVFKSQPPKDGIEFQDIQKDSLNMLDDPEERASLDQSDLRSVAPPVSTSSKSEKEGCPYSQFEMLKTIIRGDVVGVEFLDFHSEPFEPPAETWSIVSKGATIIMMKKEFILKYLRKEW